MKSLRLTILSESVLRTLIEGQAFFPPLFSNTMKKKCVWSPHFFSHLYRKRTGSNSPFQSQKMESGDDYLSLVGLLPVNPGWKSSLLTSPWSRQSRNSNVSLMDATRRTISEPVAKSSLKNPVVFAEHLLYAQSCKDRRWWGWG